MNLVISARALFLEARRDVGQLALGGNDHEERAFAEAPADVDEVGHAGAGLEHDRAKSLFGHQAARLSIRPRRSSSLIGVAAPG